MILRLAVLVELRLVTDGHTQTKHRPMASTADVMQRNLLYQYGGHRHIGFLKIQNFNDSPLRHHAKK